MKLIKIIEQLETRLTCSTLSLNIPFKDAIMKSVTDFKDNFNSISLKLVFLCQNLRQKQVVANSLLTVSSWLSWEVRNWLILKSFKLTSHLYYSTLNFNNYVQKILWFTLPQKISRKTKGRKCQTKTRKCFKKILNQKSTFTIYVSHFSTAANNFLSLYFICLI